MLGWLDRLRAPAPDPARVGWMGGTIYAHRGLHGEQALENSTPAFAAAIAAGHGIECDVQLTRDGRAAVFHDWTLERLTDQTGAVAERSLEEMSAIRLNQQSGTVPSLEDLLRQVAGKVPLLIEIKSRRERRPNTLCKAVRRALEGYRGPVAIMSFDPRVGRWFSTRAPRVLRGLVVTEENARSFQGRLSRHSALWHARPHFLAYDVRDLPSGFAAAQRARGLPLLTWTVRSPALAEIAGEYADAPIAEGAGLG
ncbi:glycerophosphodiester phosphodiesterase family protein [Altererythrobacter sp. CAU 1778]